MLEETLGEWHENPILLADYYRNLAASVAKAEAWRTNKASPGINFSSSPDVKRGQSLNRILDQEMGFIDRDLDY